MKKFSIFSSTQSKEVQMDLQKEAYTRWKFGNFIEVAQAIPSADYPNLDWVGYEEYMRAKLVDAIPGQLGRIIVNFPPEGSEDNHMHTHPKSDRVITVIGGSGEFWAIRSRTTGIEKFPLLPGYKVWMPRGIFHTFMAGKDGLLVESLHNPWVPLEDPHCLVYPKHKPKGVN